MKITVQNSFIICLLAFVVSANGQEAPHLAPPKTYWQSFGLQKQVKYTKAGYYKSDSLGYEPTMVEVYSFNNEGFLIQKYIRIYGKYGSETAHNYVYNNGVLDSINTLASSASFQAKQKLHYNSKGKLTHIISTGKFANYTDTFTYEPSGLVATIQRNHASGMVIKTVFNHRKNYVHQTETLPKGKITETYFVYNLDDLFGSFVVEKSPKVTFYKAYHHSDFETKAVGNPLEYMLKWRKTKQTNEIEFTKQMGNLQGMPSSKVIFDIPAEARNEVGDWIRRLQIDNTYARQRRLVFRLLQYADDTKSGSTEMDLLFQQKIKYIK